jgi:lysozyme
MSKQTEFIDLYKQDAVDACYGTGLFPSVMMAQAILESGWGKSQLSSQYNNFFGIKCQCKACQCYLTGSYVNMPTTEEVNGETQHINADFRTYSTPFDGFVDRINFLKSNPRYKNVFTAVNPYDQAQSLLDAGYATESNYASQLDDIINKNNLLDVDDMPANKYRVTTGTRNYAIIGGVIIALTGYIYYLKRKGVF